MSAVILAFPRRSPVRAMCAADTGSPPFSLAWCDAHLPLIDAAMDLFEADGAEFARRCALMADEDGRMIVCESPVSFSGSARILRTWRMLWDQQLTGSAAR